MAQYMMLVYEEEVDPAVQAEREQELPMFVELHRSLREAGLLVGVRRLHSVHSATSVRVRDGETEITDGPFALTKEVLAGYYILTAPTSTRRSSRRRGCRWRRGRRSRCDRSWRPTSG
jgi:hypothetical protein